MVDMIIVNLTPHDIVVRKEDDGENIVFKKSGFIARIEMEDHPQEPINGIPTILQRPKELQVLNPLGEEIDLEEVFEDEKTFYIVSNMVFTHCLRWNFNKRQQGQNSGSAWVHNPLSLVSESRENSSLPVFFFSYHWNCMSLRKIKPDYGYYAFIVLLYMSFFFYYVLSKSSHTYSMSCNWEQSYTFNETK